MNVDPAAVAAPEGVEEIELEMLLEAVHRRYGHDFRDYARASLRRRVRRCVDDERVSSISHLQERVLRDRSAFDRLVRRLSINVTSMFRDPGFYRAVRAKVVPLLRTYPHARLWHAGCSTGEEVYSMAILLEEEGLAGKYLIYATDINDQALRTAREGVCPLGVMREYTGNYLESGGRAAFSDYYTARYDLAIFRDSLREHLVFAQHDLAVDGPFNEFHVIFCRNVMIYFNERLQARVHDLIRGSLARFGVLALGRKESLRFTPHAAEFQELDAAERIYRRTT